VPYTAAEVEHSFHQYSILLDLERFRSSRDEFVEALKAEGIEAAVHYPRALDQEPFLAADNVQLANCEWLAERIASLSVHPSLSAADLDLVATAVKKAAQSSG
jgi:perosamine synthetase